MIWEDPHATASYVQLQCKMQQPLQLSSWNAAAERGGVGCMWTQVAAQAIAIQQMRLVDCKDIGNSKVPVFGGDFNDHMILHHSDQELHLMYHKPNDAERRVAVACMRHLLTETAAKMPSGKEWSAKLLI